MIRLGWRLAIAGGGPSLGVLGLTALAVAIGTAILLFALSFEPALAVRYDRAAWRDTPGQLDAATATEGLLLVRTDDHVAGGRIVRVDVAALSADAPVPPGVPEIPDPGKAWISPALASLMGSMPADQLAARFGLVGGTIDADGLMAPDELAVIVGRDPASLRADGTRVVTRIDGAGRIPMPVDPLVQVLVVIAVIGALAPVAVFVATATRLSAARREQRLATLRLAGATPRQVALFAGVEALAATIPGALAGVVLFLVLRPLVARIPLDQATWFVDAIRPPLPAAAALLVLVQVVGVVAAVVALRRVAVSPLGVRAKHHRRPLRRIRLLPVTLSAVVFGYAVVQTATRGEGISYDLVWLLGGGFFGLIMGIAIAGPWLTALVGRLLVRLAPGATALLAGHRLAGDPRGAFGAIGGVVMAVFVGSAYLSIASYAAAGVAIEGPLGLRPDVLLASVPDDGRGATTAAADVRRVPGVTDVVVVRDVAVEVSDGQPTAGSSFTTIQFGVIADCDALIRALAEDGLSCGTGGIHLGPGGEPFTHATLHTARQLGAAWSPSSTPGAEAEIDAPGAATDRYASANTPAAPGLGGEMVLPAVIVEPHALPDRGARFQPTRLAILTDGSAAAIERARTAVIEHLPTSVVHTVSEAATDADTPLTELGRVVSIGVLGAMVLAGASLTIAAGTGLVERRRPFALLRLAGMPLARLRAVLLLEAAAPLVTIAALSALLGTAVAQALLRALPTRGVPPPDLGVVLLLAVGTAGALGVVLVAMPLADRLTRPESARFE